MGSEAEAIIRQIENLDRRKQELRQELKQAQARQQFCCRQCSKKTQVKNLNAFELYQPWNDPDEPGRQAWKLYKYAVMCPKCDNLTFVRGDTERGQWIYDRRHLFNNFIEHREDTRSLSGVTMYSHNRWKDILTKKLDETIAQQKSIPTTLERIHGRTKRR